MNNWLLILLQQMLSVITPQLRQGLIEFINNLEKQAKATPNPWDDIFVGIVKSVLQIKDTE